MQVLVTGGAGFIGSHLVDALVARGDRVRILDNLVTGSEDNLNPAAEFVHGDVADWQTVQAAVDGCDLIFHQAAMVSVPHSIDDPTLNHNTNVTGTFHLFEAARQAGIRRVVYATSCSVYGNRPGLPKRESDPPAPISPYAAAKLMTEQYAAAFNACYDIECIGLRYMNVYGPRQNPGSPYSGVLSIFAQRSMAGRGVTIYGDGEQTRDFVNVQDIVRANLLASTAAFDPDNTIFNIGRGEQTSLNQIIDTLQTIIGTDIPVTYGDARLGDIRHSVADIGLARATLGFEPVVDLKRGLAETLAWFRP